MELPLHQNQRKRKYVIVNDVICMSQKVVITNLAEDKEGSNYVYILRRMVSKNRLQKREESRSTTTEQTTKKTKDQGNTQLATT